MKRLIALLILLPLSATAQTIQSGGGSVIAGSTPSLGFSAGTVPFSNGSTLAASTNFTYGNGGTGHVAINVLDLGIGMQIYTNFTNANSATVSARTASFLAGSNPASMVWANDSLLCWTLVSSGSGSDGGNSASCDTSVSRATAHVLAFGTGAQGNAAGGFVTATATLTALTTGTNADFLCLNAGGGILIQSTACTISSLRFKPDWKPYQDDAAAKVAKFDVGTFHLQTGPNADPNASALQAGLSAESVAAIAPECAIYENDMKTPKSYRQECVIALLVRAIQQLKK